MLILFLVQAEIEERREFLNDMDAVGQAHKYRTIIETEISQVSHYMYILKLHDYKSMLVQ